MNNWENIVGIVLLASVIIGGIVGIVIGISIHAKNKKKYNYTPIPPVPPPPPPGSVAYYGGAVVAKPINYGASNTMPLKEQQVVVLYAALVNKSGRPCPSCGCETSVDGARCYICGERR